MIRDEVELKVLELFYSYRYVYEDFLRRTFRQKYIPVLERFISRGIVDEITSGMYKLTPKGLRIAEEEFERPKIELLSIV